MRGIAASEGMLRIDEYDLIVAEVHTSDEENDPRWLAVDRTSLAVVKEVDSSTSCAIRAPSVEKCQSRRF